MKKWHIYIVMQVVLFLSACSSDSLLETEAESGSMVRLVLSLPESADGRVITPVETTGTTRENHLSADDLRVLIFSTESVYQEEAQSLTLDSSSGEVTGILQQSYSNCKVVVLANLKGCCTVTFPTVSAGTTTLSDFLSNLTYSYDKYLTDKILEDAEDGIIPLYGEGEITDISSNPVIGMKRALAKIEVRTKEESNITLESVYLTNYNNAGYVGVLEETWNSGWITTESLSFESSKGSYIVYVPEYNNGCGTPSTISVVIDSKTYNIEFKDYASTDGSAFNIQRNYYYEFIVKVSDDSSLIGVSFSPLEWNGEIEISVPDYK